MFTSLSFMWWFGCCNVVTLQIYTLCTYHTFIGIEVNIFKCFFFKFGNIKAFEWRTEHLNINKTKMYWNVPISYLLSLWTIPQHYTKIKIVVFKVGVISLIPFYRFQNKINCVTLTIYLNHWGIGYSCSPIDWRLVIFHHYVRTLLGYKLERWMIISRLMSKTDLPTVGLSNI